MHTLSPEPIAAALKDLYEAQAMLKSAFPEWPFSLDGKLIGDIGEVIAQKAFGLSRLPEGEKNHDMVTQEGLPVQVKATQKDRDSKPVGLGLKKTTFEHLIVIEFDREGLYEVLFNGPGSYIDEARSHKASASLSRRQLRELQKVVPADKRLRLTEPPLSVPPTSQQP
jgi:hypothetical protein